MSIRNLLEAANPTGAPSTRPLFLGREGVSGRGWEGWERLTVPWGQAERLPSLGSDLQSFGGYQARGLLRKLHDAVGVHEDLNGSRGRAPALQHLQGADTSQAPHLSTRTTVGVAFRPLEDRLKP